MNVKDIGKGILAVTITVLVFFSIGLLPNSFWNILAALGVMSIYVKNYDDVEGFMIYSFFFLSILGLLGIFDATLDFHKEGFNVNNMKYISDSLTAKQCQDACEADRECKYSIMPLNTSEAFPAKEYKCWLSQGISQTKFGNSSSGYDVWRNKKYKEPIVIKRTFDWPHWNVGRGGFGDGTVVRTTPSKPDYITIRYERFAPMYPKNLNFSAVLKDQGWGDSTKGIYIRLEGMNGENIYQVELKAPRSVRNIRNYGEIGQHKSMLVVQNDGVLVHVDKPLMLQTTGYKKTRLYGTAATARRDIVFPDQSGEVMVNESGKVMAKDLPTSDPNNAGQLWNDSGTVKISAG